MDFYELMLLVKLRQQVYFWVFTFLWGLKLTPRPTSPKSTDANHVKNKIVANQADQYIKRKLLMSTSWIYNKKQHISYIKRLRALLGLKLTPRPRPTSPKTTDANHVKNKIVSNHSDQYIKRKLLMSTNWIYNKK